MNTVCYPPGADWGCSFSPEELAEMRADPDKAAQMERAESLAWTALAMWTADSIGVCPVTVRPCAAGCPATGTWTVAPASGSYGNLAGRGGGFNPWINAQGAWVNGCGCSSTTDCPCEQIPKVILPGPVGGIVDVWLFGRLMDPSEYRVINGNELTPTSPDVVWPGCQDLQQDARGESAFSVTYYRGSAPAGVVLSAVGALASEFYKDCMGQECALPSGLRSISRTGITAEFEAPEGLTGIREVDVVIRRLNPHLLKTRPRIISPDYSGRARVIF